MCKELYFDNYVTIALITSFEANSRRTGGSGRDKDMDKPEAIVPMHLADDSNDDSYDDVESVGSFESDDSNNGRTNSDDKSVKDEPIPTSKKKMRLLVVL